MIWVLDSLILGGALGMGEAEATAIGKAERQGNGR